MGRLGPARSSDGRGTAAGVSTRDRGPAKAAPRDTGEDGYGPSDQTSFYARDVPVLHFFTNAHADYHRPTDKWERVDAAGLARVASMVTRLARAAADRGTTLTLVRGAGRPPAAAQGRGYGAYLGSIPTSPVERGVRLTGVRAGSPPRRRALKAATRSSASTTRIADSTR